MKIDDLGIVVEDDPVQGVEYGLGVVVSVAVLRAYGELTLALAETAVLLQQGLRWTNDDPDVEGERAFLDFCSCLSRRLLD